MIGAPALCASGPGPAGRVDIIKMSLASHTRGPGFVGLGAMPRSGTRTRLSLEHTAALHSEVTGPLVSLEIWDSAALETRAARLESLANGMPELGGEHDSASRALDLAHALRASSWALEFVDPDDDDAVVVVLERLAELEAEAMSLLTLWQDDEVTRPYEATWKSVFTEDEPTRVVARRPAAGLRR